MRKLLFAFVATLFSFSAMAGGHAEWWKNAGAPYAGTTLQGIAENTPPQDNLLVMFWQKNLKH